MSTSAREALTLVAPVAFVGVDTVLLVAAGLAGGGALIAVILASRGGRGRASAGERVVRRAPSPSSLGMEDDPIVASLVVGDGSGRPRRVRSADRVEP